MSDAPTPLDIPAEVLAEVYREARRAFPFECCGWLAGPADSPIADIVRNCENAQDSGTHPTQAERGAETAYVITGSDLLALNHSLDSETPAKLSITPTPTAGPTSRRPTGKSPQAPGGTAPPIRCSSLWWV